MFDLTVPIRQREGLVHSQVSLNTESKMWRTKYSDMAGFIAIWFTIEQGIKYQLDLHGTPD